MMTPKQLYAHLSNYGLTNCDIHTHTTFCDGKNSPAEMADAAVKKGLSCLGFSGHAYTSFDSSCCMSKEGTLQYKAEVIRLKKEYRGRLDILLGIEEDLYSEEIPTDTEFDYMIGSAHYLRTGKGEYLPVDESPDIFRAVCSRYYGGNYLSMAEHYFETLAGLASLPILPTVIGHVDLITKYNRNNALFDESDPRYLAAAHEAVDALLATGALFEINTGVISRGWRDRPYPSELIYRYISEHGGCFILTGDTHSAENLCYHFDQFSQMLG